MRITIPVAANATSATRPKIKWIRRIFYFYLYFFTSLLLPQRRAMLARHEIETRRNPSSPQTCFAANLEIENRKPQSAGKQTRI